jgi:serine/threonine protein kinase
MELGAQNLEDYIKQEFSGGSGVPTFEVWRITLQIACGVDFIHRCGMIHRDIKPANVILSRDTRWYVWKIADFGISTAGTSATLLVTRDGRGTSSYCAPEILCSESSLPSYNNKVDIWGIGVILYELCSAQKAFPTGYEAMRYMWNEVSCPQVSVANYPQASIPEIRFDAAEVRGLRAMWQGALLAGAAFPSLVPNQTHFTDSVQHRLEDMNQHISWLLAKEPAKRPSIKDVCLHMAANAIQKSLELGNEFSDYPAEVISTIIEPPEIVPLVFDPSRSISRWQFVIKTRTILGQFHYDSLYRALKNLAMRFLINNVEDPALNRNLSILFDQRPDLSAEFKSLYVYGYILDRRVDRREAENDEFYNDIMECASAKGLCIGAEYVSSESDLPV